MQNARLVGVVLGAFALVGVVMMAVEAERLIRWRPVPAVVQVSAVQAVRGNKGGTSFRPVVTYAYAVHGQRYTSTQVNVLAVSKSYGWAQSMSTRFVPGAPTTAYVSPDDPPNAYLVHEISLLPLCIHAHSGPCLAACFCSRRDGTTGSPSSRGVSTCRSWRRRARRGTRSRRDTPGVTCRAAPGRPFAVA